MAVDPLTASAAALATKLIGEMVGGLKKPIASKIIEWKTPAKIKALGKKLAVFEQVKTLSNPEKSQKLEDFYLPPKFSYTNGKSFSVKKIEDFGIEDHPLVEGIAGQGKSMFMRQLLISELQQGDRLPVLIELRKITPKTTVIDLIFSFIKSLGFPEESFVWSYLAEQGKLVLLLDGFDEVVDDLRSGLLHDIERIVIENPELKMAITTRPEATIRGVPFLRSVKLDVLSGVEREKIIRKQCNSLTAQSLIDGLTKNQELFEMIDAPLFVTLLCVAYRAEQYIPDTTHEFYDLVFNTLLYRHDAFKPGFERPRKSSLGNSNFCKVFENFCFISLKNQLVRMSEERANIFIAEALDNESVTSTDSDKYFSDLVKITCLLVQDGTEYQFLHKSIQDYFCAKYIARLPDDIAFKFYSKVLRSAHLVRSFNQALRFLKGIDTYRYIKYFQLPAVSYVFSGNYELNVENIDKCYSFDETMSGVFGDAALVFNESYRTRAIFWGDLDQSVLHALADFFEISRIFSESVFHLFGSDAVLAKLPSLKSDDVYIKKYEAHIDATDISVGLKNAIVKLRLKGKFSDVLLSDERMISLKSSVRNAISLVRKTDSLSNKLDLF